MQKKDQYTQYRSLIFTFKNIYNFYPGDMPIANQIWPSANNGNGNGLIGDNTETAEVWVHLNFANLVPYSSSPSFDILNNTSVSISNSSTVIYSVAARTKTYISLVPTIGTTNIISPLSAYNMDIKTDDGIPNTGRMLTFNLAPTVACVKQANGTTNAIYTYTGSATYYVLNTFDACNKMYFYLE
ncbi:MAG: hypothetical protein ACK4OM_02340 [Alphaproteobacteria bacterium]